MTTKIISPYFFNFESDFVDTLRCIPMIVRYKLDTCGIKLKLSDWAKISVREKEKLAHTDCFSSDEIENYGAYVKILVRKHSGNEAGYLSHLDDTWNNEREVPEEVRRKITEFDCNHLTAEQWTRLNTLQRFALVKLSRSGHEGRNFPVALKEFGIA